MLAMMRADVLEELGYKIIPANSGQQALALAEAGQESDLLLTDIVIPGPIGGF